MNQSLRVEVIIEVLQRTGCQMVADNDPGVCRFISPENGLPIIVPMGIDSLPEQNVRFILSDSGLDSDALIAEMIDFV